MLVLTIFSWPQDAAGFFLLVCACQFHLVFYASRSLPNTYALVLVLLALGCWLRGHWRRAVTLMTLTTVAFRGDTVLLLAPVALSLLLERRAGFLSLAVCGIAAGIGSLALTVAVDSYFWYG